jgi:hypothetical protein
MTTEQAGSEASASFQHCVAVYEAMLSRSDLALLDHNSQEESSVYTGFTTKLFAEIGLSVPYYSKIMKLLQAMDCIRQLRRGGGPSASQWLLIQAPTVELFDRAEVVSKGAEAPEDQRWKDLNNRLIAQEELMETVLAEVFPQ